MSIKHPPLTRDAAPFDEENPEWTPAMFARVRQAGEALPPDIAAAFARARGRLPLKTAKIAVKLRLDPAVVEGFKAGGPGWQTRINATLKAALERQGG